MLSTVRTYASFVKLSHTVFALPFAIAGMVAAYAVPPEFHYPSTSYGKSFSHIGNYEFRWATLALILCCMVGARSFAMAANRILDRKIDALNPRTAQRELPSGKLSVGSAWGFALASAAIYFGACFMLGRTVLLLSPIPLILMYYYPYTKRHTALCHFVLGASLGLAPVGAWIAVRYMGGILQSSEAWRRALFGSFNIDCSNQGALDYDITAWLLGAAVMLWVTGFDIVYALQDEDFDRKHGLHSIPAKVGRVRALWISRLIHATSALCFFWFVWAITQHVWYSGIPAGRYLELAPWVWAAPCVMLVGMIYQHSLVKPNDLSRVNVAFFTVNGIISVIFGAIFVAAWLLA